MSKPPPMIRKLRSLGASPLGVTLLFEEQASVHLDTLELRRLLRELAENAPQLLHEALEERLIERTARAVQRTLADARDLEEM